MLFSLNYFLAIEIKKGQKITKINRINPIWHLSFELILKKSERSNKWKNILRISNGTFNHLDVWLAPSSKVQSILQICYKINIGKYCFLSNPVENKESEKFQINISHERFTFDKYSYQIHVNKTEMAHLLFDVHGYMSYQNLIIYASDPWSVPAKASIEGFNFVTKGNPSRPRRKPSNKEKNTNSTIYHNHICNCQKSKISAILITVGIPTSLILFALGISCFFKKKCRRKRSRGGNNNLTNAPQIQPYQNTEDNKPTYATPVVDITCDDICNDTETPNITKSNLPGERSSGYTDLQVSCANIQTRVYADLLIQPPLVEQQPTNLPKKPSNKITSSSILSQQASNTIVAQHIVSYHKMGCDNMSNIGESGMDDDQTDYINFY